MYRYIVFIILAAVVTAAPKKLKIVGGNTAANGAFPYQVSLRHIITGDHFCGGSIIDENWILTAAHCVNWLPEDEIRVVVGTNQLNSGGTSYYVDTVIINSNYVQVTNGYDIALLHTNASISLSTNVQIVLLAILDPANGTAATVSGWGLTSYPSSTPPNDLQYLNLNILTEATCKSDLGTVGANMIGNICTTSPSGKGACRGDSGGPLVISVLGIKTQVGIVSWGIPCALGQPDVYTSVAYYSLWITTNMIL